jgi:hypothetical protein
MKKIGILTFHRAVNYGAVLQTWALFKRIKDAGPEVSIIDYRPNSIELTYKPFSFIKLFENKSPKAQVLYLLDHIFKYRMICIRNQAFANFRNENLKIDGIDKIKDFDVLISGSDQVWNPNLTKGLDKFYYLNIPAKEGVKKISYGASSELAYFKELITNHKDFLVKNLNSFNAISVREPALSDVLSKYIKKNIDVVLDPTLLLNAEDYEEIITMPLEKEPYVLVYQVVDKKETMRIARKISNERKLKIIFLNSRYRFYKRTTNLKGSIGPSEFLSLFKNASYIVTTSFHGTIFSIIFKKNFYTVVGKHSSRQTNLLNQLNLSSRILTKITDLEKITHIDYLPVTKSLDQLRKESELFLMNNL